MPTRSSKSKDHDFVTLARRVVEQAIGEHLDGTPLNGAPDQHAKSGRLGGLKGGSARATSLTPERRRAIAQKAAKKRWQSND
jgi:hypothetical protein